MGYLYEEGRGRTHKGSKTTMKKKELEVLTKGRGTLKRSKTNQIERMFELKIGLLVWEKVIEYGQRCVE